jgi:hypothetical protein
MKTGDVAVLCLVAGPQWRLERRQQRRLEAAARPLASLAGPWFCYMVAFCYRV